MKGRGLRVLLYAGAVSVAALVPALALGARPSSTGPEPRLGPDSYEIRMISRQFTPGRGVAAEALEEPARRAAAAGRSRFHALVQLDHIPTQAEKNLLRREGLVLLEYIPNYAWIAAIPAGNPAQVAQLPGVRWAGRLAAADKTDPSLAIESSPWAYDEGTGQVALYVTMHRDVSRQAGEALLSSHGEVASYAPSANLYVLLADKNRVDALLEEDLVGWVQPAEPKWEPINNETRAWIDSDILDGAGYGDADGTDVDILIYDGGHVRSTHLELTGRVTTRDTGCAVSDHSTHVACTTSASGGYKTAATGHANDMHALLSDCLTQDTGVFYYTDPGELEQDLVYAKDAWNPSGGDGEGAELLNASVGTNTAPNGWPCAWEGNYGPTSIILDNVVRGDAAGSGKLIAVWANGNERGSSNCGTGYYSTAPPACAKNPIQVGATNKDADTMTSFSSWGPCDDGRIKPVVSAPGCALDPNAGIYSCTARNDRAYNGSYCGTSMASPAVAGVVAQLIEYCRKQGLSYCSGSSEFWPSSAKALLMHAAVDLGNPGPDYQFGYGRVDADATADLITYEADGPDFRQDQIADQGEIDEYQITISGGAPVLTVTLAWDDEAATMQALSKLVNDLDLEVVAPDSTVHRPYVLDPGNPGSAATTGADHVNNQEQVVVSGPLTGTWTIRVIGTAVPAAPQDYTIVFPGAYSTVAGETPGATPTPTPAPDPAYCSEQITNGGFESGTAGWTTSGSAQASSTYATEGAYSMQAGGTAAGAFYQDIAIPADMYTGTISFQYRMQTAETSHPWDFYDVEVRDPATDTALTTLLSTDDSKTNATWIPASFAVGPEYAGQSIRMHFSAAVDGVVDTYWYVDEVSVYVCQYAPTAVELAGFSATAAGRDAIITWETANEVDLVGFNLYRSLAAEGEYLRLNADLIPAQWSGSPWGGVYAWPDADVVSGVTYYYRLEALHSYGVAALHGPEAVTIPYLVYLPLLLRQ